MTANRTRRRSNNRPDVISVPEVTAPYDHEFWLVQRLEQRHRTGKAGFDSKFHLDYMGSSEFEFGAVPQSLKRIRAKGDLVMAAVELTRDDVVKTVYFVAPREGLAEKVADFRIWFSKSRLPGQERTDFDVVFTEKYGVIKKEYVRTNAWWSLDDDIAWALDRNIAQQLLEGFAPPA